VGVSHNTLGGGPPLRGCFLKKRVGRHNTVVVKQEGGDIIDPLSQGGI